MKTLLTLLMMCTSTGLARPRPDPVLEIVMDTILPMLSPIKSFPNYRSHSEGKNYSKHFNNEVTYLPISPACRFGLTTYGAALEAGAEWALRSWDSSGKFPPPGLREGNFFALGSYDECLSHARSAPDMAPAYCSVEIDTSRTVFSAQGGYDDKILGTLKTGGFFFRAMPGIFFRLGWCVPSGCLPRDVWHITKAMLDILRSDIAFQMVLKGFPPANLSIADVSCTGPRGVPIHLRDNILDTEVYTSRKVIQITREFRLAAIFFALSIGIVVMAHFICDGTGGQGQSYSFKGKPVTIYFKIVQCFAPRKNLNKILFGDNKRNLIDVTTNSTPSEINKCPSYLCNGGSIPKSRDEAITTEVKDEPRPMDILYGIRSLSMMHAILAHTYVFSIFVVRNLGEVVGPNMFKDHFIVFLFSGFFAVDTFFFLSGFLCAMTSGTGGITIKTKVNTKNGPKGTVGRYCDTPEVATFHLKNGDAKHRRIGEKKTDHVPKGELDLILKGSNCLNGNKENGVGFGKKPKIHLGYKAIALLRMYLYRYVRLTPLYASVLILEIFILPHIFGRFGGGGPLKAQSAINEANCKSFWWANLLYINNVVGTRRMCGIWTWYLANDVQFHLMAPFLLALYWGGRKGITVRYITLTTLLILAVTGSFVNSVIKELRAGLFADDPKILEAFYDYYIVPVVRISPFLMGMILGCMLRNSPKTTPEPQPLAAEREQLANDRGENENDTFPKFRNFMYAAMAPLIPISIIIAINYYNGIYLEGNKVGVIVAGLINSMARVVWSCLIGSIIYNAYVWKRFKSFTSILTHKAWVPISNLTYAAYLIHPLAIQTVNRNLREPLYMTHTLFVALAIGYWTVSHIVAIIFSMTFEIPAINFAKTFIRSWS